MSGPSNIMAVMQQAARKASRSLLRDFGEVEHLQVSRKGPADFVSRADKKAEEVIYESLREARPGYGFLMEESGEIEGSDKTHRFIVDPLDGTKEFIRKGTDFTVNIALVEHGVPTRGVVYAPAMDRLFRTDGPGRALEESPGSGAQTASISVVDPAGRDLLVVASKSHRDQATDDYISLYPVADFTSAGSSLKFCLVATGEAHLYPRLGPTMEWDTAAGHAVLLGAGGKVVRFDNHEPLQYGKEGYANPFFIAYAPGVELKEA